MSRNFSTREKVLLVIFALLAAGALYFLGVIVPTTDIISAANTELEELSTLIAIEEEKTKSLTTMLESLDTLEGDPETRVFTPPFDNFQNLLDELDAALVTAEDYKLNFVDPVIADGLAKRELQLVFYSNSYSAARWIIDKLYTGPYRCEISKVSISPTERESTNITVDPITVTMSIIYYELAKQ